MITPGPFVASWPKEFLRQPGIEPGSIAWEATMLTITPLTQRDIKLHDDVAFNKRIYVEKMHVRFILLSDHTTPLQSPFCNSVGGVKVSIVAFQAIDPGSIPG